MQVHFKIHGQGKKNLNGDGLAIWYTKERVQKGDRRHEATWLHFPSRRNKIPQCVVGCPSVVVGPVFGNKDNFTGLGVFVDTYPNEEKQLEVQLWLPSCDRNVG